MPRETAGCFIGKKEAFRSRFKLYLKQGYIDPFIQLLKLDTQCSETTSSAGAGSRNDNYL